MRIPVIGSKASHKTIKGVLLLIEQVQGKVKAKSGVELETEVKVVGER